MSLVQAKENNKDEDENSLQKGSRTRQKSRIGRQHSYDDEIKNAGSSQFPAAEPGLGLPVALPRRASAYDVYAFRQGEGIGAPPGLGGPTGNTAVPPTGRRASFRVASKNEDPPCKFFTFEPFVFIEENKKNNKKLIFFSLRSTSARFSR